MDMEPQEKPPMHSRSDWKAVEVDPEKLSPLGTPQYITVHHTGSLGHPKNPPTDELEDTLLIQKIHFDKDWSDIGYHYVVSQPQYIDGTDICVGREKQPDGSLSLGAHVGGHNTGNIGITVVGDYSDGADPDDWGRDFTAGQQAVLEDLIAWLCWKYNIEPTEDNIKGHRDWAATECPGDKIYRKLPEIRANVEARLYPGCQSSCESICQLPCETCETCDVSCQSSCELSCQSTCQLDCQTTCQLDCQSTCQLDCQSTCQLDCQSTCELSCQSSCESTCQFPCETCETCDVSCQSSCELSCQSSCESTCQFPCETCETCDVSCQSSCELSCQSSCESTCQFPCETCETCDVSCQTTCQLDCQDVCETYCQAVGEQGPV